MLIFTTSALNFKLVTRHKEMLSEFTLLREFSFVIILHVLVMTDLHLPEFGLNNKPVQPLCFQFLKHEFGKAKVM